MNRFCRHNRFIERCPICRETVPGLTPPAREARRARPGAEDSTRHVAPARKGSGPRRGRGAPALLVRREVRAEDDGYRSALVPGLRASRDAERLAEEVAFAEGRMIAIRLAPPDLYGEIRDEEDPEQATWMCFLSAYLCPLEGDDPFEGVRRALQADWRAGELPDLSAIPLGPRTSHDPARGEATLRAYLHWSRALDADSGGQRVAFGGDPAWTAQRRFERIFERLRLPGLARMGRYDLLVTLGRIGLHELSADSLHLAGARSGEGQDLTTVAAKRLFAIGDPMVLERRARRLAEEAAVPLEALDLALANWEAGERATLGVDPDALDAHALDRVRAALEL